MTTSPVRVGGDDALHLLGGVVLAAVADRVGQRFIERQLDRDDLGFGPALALEQLLHALADSGNARRLGGNDDVHLAGRGVGHQRGELVHLLQRGTELGDSATCSACARVAVGERLLQLPQFQTQLQLILDLVSERVERAHLTGREAPRLDIDHAQGAQRVAVRRHERRARVEADMGLAGDEGIVAEALVFPRIRDLEDAGVRDGVGAERDGSLGLPHAVEAVLGLEPLSVLVDQRDQRHRRTADLRRQQRQVVERPFRRGVENAIAPEGGQTGLFVDWGHADLGWLLMDTPDEQVRFGPRPVGDIDEAGEHVNARAWPWSAIGHRNCPLGSGSPPSHGRSAMVGAPDRVASSS